MSNEVEFGLIVLGLLILFFACYAPLLACGEWLGGRLWKFLTWLCCTTALLFVTFTLIQWQFGPEAILPPWGLASWVFGPLAIILWGLAWVFEWETRDNMNRFAAKTLTAPGGFMPTKKVLIVVATVLGTLVGYFFKETYWAVVIEASVDNFAHSLGMGRPELIGAAAPYFLSLVACYALVAIAYALGAQERAQQPAFEILYDANDPRFVRPLNGGFQYFVCLHILANRSIRAPNIRVLESEFTKKVFAPDHYPKDGPYLQGTVQLYSGGQLDPDDREFIWLCDLPDYEYLKPDYERSPLLTVQRFTLEARGENARVVRAEFEYDPDKKPMIRKLSGATSRTYPLGVTTPAPK